MFVYSLRGGVGWGGGVKDAEAHQQNTTQNQCLQEKMSGQSERREESGKNAYEERLTHTQFSPIFIFCLR